MRIGFDAKRYFENKTGLGNYSRNLINALINEYPENEYFLYTPDKPSKEHISKYLDMSNIKIRYAKNSQKHYWRTRGILKNLIEDKLDVYHGLSNELPFGIHKTKINTVATIHDLLFKKFHEDYRLIDRMIYDWKSEYACKSADRVIAISQATQESIIEQYHISEENILVIRQSIDPVFFLEVHDEFQNKVLEEHDIPKDYLLFVGNGSRRKNLITVLKSLKYLSERRNLVLVLNRLKLSKECEELIQNENLSSQIKRLVNIPTKELVVIYKNASCLIYPSLGEGWGLPVEEAIACNTRVIVPEYKPFTERLSELKIYLKDPGNPSKLAKRIESLGNNKFNFIQSKRKNDTKCSDIHQIYRDFLTLEC